MLHTIQEWEEKKPFNVEFTTMKLEKGEVLKATAYEVNTHVVLTYDRKGHAYCVVSPDGNKMLRVDDEGEVQNMTLDELQMLLPVPQSEYDIKW